MAVYNVSIYSFGGLITRAVNVPEGHCVVVEALELVKRLNGKEQSRFNYLKKVDSNYARQRIADGFRDEYRLRKILGRAEGLAGKDQWGLFYPMTGLEAAGTCFWCGAASIRGRYCTERHGLMYKRHFNWAFARDWCWRRYANQCGLCGVTNVERNPEWRYRSLEVHHIEPLNAGFREWTLLNRPENLILLCPPCHDSTRRKDFEGIVKQSVNPKQLILI